MLKNLHIENIAVIEQADLTLEDGLNVLTGETGAGKSIVIDAINAVLGERTSRERIRTGCETATVSALFCDLTEPVVRQIAALGYFPDADGNLLLRRTIRADGKGTAFLNGQAVTAGILREVGRFLINIHGQHDNQALLDPQTHLTLLDRLAENEAEQAAYLAEFRAVNAIRRELRELQADEAERTRRAELLKFQVDELEKAQIEPGEIAALKEKAETFRNYEKLTTHLQAVRLSLLGDDSPDGPEGAVAAAETAGRELQAAGAAALSADAEKLVELQLELQSVADDVTGYLDNLSFSPEELEKIESRLDFLHRMMLKYGDSEDEMLAFLADAQARLQADASAEDRISALEAELERTEERLIARGEVLTATRKRAAAQLEREVCETLRGLDMPQVEFVVQIEPGKYAKRGCDLLEFLISTNPGAPPKPLVKIASGGELSRIMLAIKSVLAGRDEVDTLIFDEIDSGISGRAAQKVGRQLARVAKVRQVICVTHLAQIAVMAQHHLLIEKTVSLDNTQTYTSVTVLTKAGRVQEIARIMAGAEPSETVLRSAKELLDRSMNDDLI